MTKVSPLAPGPFPEMPPVAGVRLATAAAGIRYKDRPDLLLATMAPETTAAGCLHPLADRLGPRRVVPQGARRQGAGTGRQRR